MSEPEIAIIGGGFCGTALALHLAEQGLDVALFEPRAEIGRGLAYGSDNPVHRINVPAQRMSLYPDLPDDFMRYLAQHPQRDDPDLLAENGDPYPRRSVFGAYVHAAALPHLRAGRIRHIRSRIVAVHRRGGLWDLQSDSGKQHSAEIVVLAASHPAAALPKALRPVAGDKRVLHEGLAIAPEARVLVVGTGLSAADEIASLISRGHRGEITAISRRGLRSRGHAKGNGTSEHDFTAKGQSAETLLRKIRQEIARVEAQGGEWQSVIDRVRAQGQALWRDLSPKDRRRILRHLRPYWDVHRFRIAPQIEKLLDKALLSGQVRLFAAHLLAAKPKPEALAITLKPKGQAPETRDFDALILTTGPDHAKVLQSQPLFESLADAGLITACPTGLGIACDSNAQALSAKGTPTEALFLCGPLARGTFGELMGLPQVAEQARTLALYLRQKLQQRQTIKV